MVLFLGDNAMPQVLAYKHPCCDAILVFETQPLHTFEAPSSLAALMKAM